MKKLTKVMMSCKPSSQSSKKKTPPSKFLGDVGHNFESNFRCITQKNATSDLGICRLTSFSMHQYLIRGNISFNSGPGITSFIRYIYHNDMEVPDFTEYRRNSVKSPNIRAIDSADQRRLFTYSILGLYGLTLMYGTKAHGLHYVMFLGASAEVMALAKIEINLSEIPEGINMTFKWRGKPLFVKHRTEEQIEIERNVDISTLIDPQTDDDRVKDPHWLILIGVCTHLGCVPIADAGDYNGYYCPCHGSHFDGSGRARKGPAPTNLEIPEYVLDLENNMLTVG